MSRSERRDIFLALGPVQQAKLYRISTFAGTPKTQGFGGDGGLAIKAKLNSPGGVFGLGDGRVLIADWGNHVVRVVDRDGIISTFAGTPGKPGFGGDGGPAIKAKLCEPKGVFGLFDGRVLITDWGNHVVRVVEGWFRVKAGGGRVGGSEAGGV